MRLSGQDLRAGMAGAEVGELHAALARIGFAIPEGEYRHSVFGAATVQAVASFQKAHGLPANGVVDRDTAATLTRTIAEAEEETVMLRLEPQQPRPQPVPVPKPAPNNGSSPAPGAPAITGRVYLEYGGPAADLTLRAYRRGFGGAATLLGEASTAADGRYRIEYQGDAGNLNLELRAVQPGEEEISLTLTAIAVDPGEALNVVAPASVRPLGAEYQRLRADLVPHLHGRPLGTAKETPEQPDLSLLQEATGWDARLVAFAASAERVSEMTGVGVPAAYAMLRAGLPGDSVGLAGVMPSTVDRALAKAAGAGVVDLTAAERQTALEAFTTFRRSVRLAARAPGALSSQSEMLAAAGLSTQDAARFDEIYAAQRGGDPQQLWQEASAAGLPVDTLQLTGKLGYLTLNNAALTKAIQRETSNGLGAGLAAGGLYRPQAWTQRLTAMAGGGDTALADLVPPAFEGKTTQARVEAYSQDLARKVRISFPTNVVGHLVGTGQLPLSDPSVRGDVATFLNRAADLGVALGRTPVSAMLREHGDVLLAGLPQPRADAVTENVKTLQRIYQITPSDEAMAVLLDNGFRSAHDVTGLPAAKFLKHYGGKFSTVGEAELVYRKAQQASSVSHAAFTMAKQLDSSPPVFALSGPPEAKEAAKTELIKHFPTMEELFGSLDYCACDHCRSVLSPAAYLVDLLHFLDPPADTWAVEMTLWRAEHGAPYPFADDQAWQDYQDRWAIDHPHQSLPETELSPYQVLAMRRPDLGQLPLTCENTNTAMPYLDVVNEILEFYVAYGRLAPDAVRDTGTALTADLLAEPQYLISKAYDILGQASYPVTLPFDLWLETVRRLLDHFEAPLWTVLDALRPTDDLYPRNGEPYGQAAVAIERLGLSRGEYDLLTDANVDARWHERYGYPAGSRGQQQALAELANAKTLSRRLGVTYQELLDLMTTGFVNPRLVSIAVLPRLGLGISDVLRYFAAPGHVPYTPEERAAFEAALAPIGGPVALGDLWDPAELGRILVLADPSGDCGFDTTIVQYADGSPADAIAYTTLNYLVRLWRRLDWTLAETDSALQVFLPVDPDPRTTAAIGRAMSSALLGLSQLDALRSLLPGSRTDLLALWSDLTPARYTELFLVPSTPTADPVFDQPLGRYLEALVNGDYQPFTWDPAQPESAADGNVGLVNHVGTVQAALQLSADDVARILADAGTTLEAAPLDLATVSLLHRYGVLARRLRLPVADLIALRQMSGLDPFARPHPKAVLTLSQDSPYRTVRFAEAVLAVGDSGLAVSEADYLLRHRYDPAGSYAVQAAPPLGLVRILDGEIARISTEHADPVDSTAISDEELRQKLALVLAADTVERFFGMWTGTITYDAMTTGVDPADQLDPAAVAGEPAVTLTYDPVRAEQHLLYRGVLIEDEKRRLVLAHPGPADATVRYTELLNSVQQTAWDFFEANLLTPVGFLERADFELFFAPPVAGATELDLQEALAEKRDRLVATSLPYLRDKLIDQAVLSIVGAEHPDDPVLVTALLTEPVLLADRLWPGMALLSGFRAAGERGLTQTVDAAAQTAIVDVYLEVPTAGSYRFFVACAHGGTAVDLTFEHLTDPLLLTTTAIDGEEVGALVDLSPGVMYHLRLSTTATAGQPVTLLVQGQNLPKGTVDRLTCHPADQVDRVGRAAVLLAKAVRLAEVAGLTEPELRHMLTHAGDFGGLSLAQVPVTAAEDLPEQATKLFADLLRLLDHAALRSEIGAAPGELTDLFAQARQTYPAALGTGAATDALLTDMHSRMAVLTRRDTTTVAEAADRLGVGALATTAGDVINAVAAAFANEIGVRRLWTVLSLAGRLGITPGVLAATANTTPGMAGARQLRDAVRAVYDVTAWRRVAQPIFDTLRQRRRDALVAWVMHADGFDRIEQLFEYFLVDPGAEPVLQTSRLRLAISAVQLFIQRCLLNLEPGVHPTMINSEYWQWMKRYRVWEANRKIFLWPENWLEPEFRDDKTHLFQALESSLFAGDVTNDLAETAFFTYLRSLEVLSRLDVRAMYLEEDADPLENKVHVVARTFGAPYTYFYRCYAYGVWGPWIPVTAEIEGGHMAASVWQGRVHLFWVTFVEMAASGTNEQTLADMADDTTADIQRLRIIHAHLHWTEYYQGEWTDAASGGLAAPIVLVEDASWSPGLEVVHVSHDGDALLIHISGTDRAFRVDNKNSPPESVYDTLLPPEVPYSTVAFGVQNYGLGPLGVYYVDRITTEGPTVVESHSAYTQILNQILPGDLNYSLRVVGNHLSIVDPEEASLTNPIFYQDHHHSFYVQPVLTETTVAEWGDWVIPSVSTQLELETDSYWDGLDLIGQVPRDTQAIPDEAVATVSKYDLQPRADWVTSSGNTVVYQGTAIKGSVTANGLEGQILDGRVIDIRQAPFAIQPS